MRASKPSNEIKNQVADQNLIWQSTASARESHYSDRRFFCNPFFETFAFKIAALILWINDRPSSHFLWSQTTLVREDRWSHHRLLDVSITIETILFIQLPQLEFLGKNESDIKLKNCSPSVGAKTSYYVFLVPQLIERSFCDLYRELEQPPCMMVQVWLNVSTDELMCCHQRILQCAADVCKLL